MSENFWAELYDSTGFCNDDSYIVQLLREFRFLTDEKTEQTNAQAGSLAAGNEAPESF